MRAFLLPSGLLTVLFLTLGVESQDTEFTRCKGNDLDWYTGMTGENPCSAYQRLRQQCDSAYRVGRLTPNTREDASLPPDTCDTQVSDCCCNSVAFSLAMLCVNCQHGPGGGSGYDVSPGAYERYLGRCVDKAVNKTLPANVQAAVCNEKPQIRIPDFIYKAFWGDGAFFYTHVRQRTEIEFNSKGNDSFTHCPQQNMEIPPSTETPQPSTATSRGMSVGAIAGIAVGGVMLVGLLVAVFLLLRRRKQKKSFYPDTQEIAPYTPFLRTMADPYVGGAHERSESRNKNKPPPPANAAPRPYMPEKHRRMQSNTSNSGPQNSEAGRSSSPSTALSSIPQSQPIYDRDAGPVRFPPRYDENWLTAESSDTSTAASHSRRN